MFFQLFLNSKQDFRLRGNDGDFYFSGCLCHAQRQPETLALRQRKEWVWRRYAMFCFRLRKWLGQPENVANPAINGAAAARRYFPNQ
nr:MAG TPA: hypothetical protein [Bacteriophage sp.]